MKLDSLLRHLRLHGCVLRREGKEPRFGRTRPRVTQKRFLGTSRSRICLRSVCPPAIDSGSAGLIDGASRGAVAVRPCHQFLLR